MKIKSLFVPLTFYCFMLGTISVEGQSVDEGLKTINEASLKAQLNFLASDWMEGRESETKGAYMAGDYIASMFQVFGIEPYGDMEYNLPLQVPRGYRPEAKPSYFQKFNIVKYKMSEKQEFSLIQAENGAGFKKTYKYGIDYTLSGIETDTEVESPVVFVGYGIKNDSLKINDFAKVNVKGKIIIRLDGYPGFRDTTSVSFKKLRFLNLWNDKDKWALEAGAIGIIHLSAYPAKDFGKVGNQPYRYKSGSIEADQSPERFYDKRAVLVIDSLKKSIPVIRISARLQSELSAMMNFDMNQFELDAKNSIKQVSKEIPFLRIALKSGVDSELMTVRNILGMIEGEKKDEFIVVGGHYDHLGKYGGYIFNGADDNASGTVGVLSIARALKASGKKPVKTIIFAAWTAEEKGLLGSEYFVRSFPGVHRISLNLNLDMISRSRATDTSANICGMVYTSEYKGLQEMSKKNVKEYGLNLDVRYSGSDRPSGGSDYAPFAKRGVPVIALMAAMHPDYHQPSDEVTKIEWKKMEQIIKLSYLNIYELANSDINTYRLTPKTK